MPFSGVFLACPTPDFDFTLAIWISDPAGQGDHAVVRQNIAIQWIQAGIVDVGDQHPFAKIIQNHDSRRSAQPPKGLLMQLGPDAGTGTEAQQPNRFATVAQRQNEHPGTPVFAALRVAHHRAAAVINLRLFAGRRFDHHPRFRGSPSAQFAHETLHALVASRKPVTVDQILPDPHRIAASRQPQLDRFPIQLAGTGRCLAAFFHWRCRRPRVGGHLHGRF